MMDDDRQQDELYKAEQAVDWSPHGGDKQLLDLREVWTLANNLFNRASFQKRYPHTYNRLAVRKGTRAVGFSQGHLALNKAGVAGGIPTNPDHDDRASYDTYDWDGEWYRPKGLQVYAHTHGGRGSSQYIALSNWARQKFIIVHELAHVVDINEHGAFTLRHQPHGWQFAAIYLQLTQSTLGTNAAKALKASFKNHNVLHTQAAGQRRYPDTTNRKWNI